MPRTDQVSVPRSPRSGDRQAGREEGLFVAVKSLKKAAHLRQQLSMELAPTNLLFISSPEVGRGPLDVALGVATVQYSDTQVRCPCQSAPVNHTIDFCPLAALIGCRPPVLSPACTLPRRWRGGSAAVTSGEALQRASLALQDRRHPVSAFLSSRALMRVHPSTRSPHSSKLQTLSCYGAGTAQQRGTRCPHPWKKPAARLPMCTE